MRGSPLPFLYGVRGIGSIPAGAGEPFARRRYVAAQWVYPRGCGGARFRCHHITPAKGLSPRVRGSPDGDDVAASVAGSIPAGAGEPHSRTSLESMMAVYPRGCGGAQWRPQRRQSKEGLSPRVRGSLCVRQKVVIRHRSIPAGAGEPVYYGNVSCCSWVYPRGCGGARNSEYVFDMISGLSPRVRGSHTKHHHPQ